jgi:glycosyltransferase involved in cell wall biosynthesis
MKYLFIHQNYPGQFRHLAAALAATPGNHIAAIADEKSAKEAAASLPANAVLLTYASPPGASKETHQYLRSYEASIRRGQQVARLLLTLRDKGYTPDIICVHAGWGEALFIKEVFPKALVLGYFEFFYRTEGADVGFDDEFYKNTLDDNCRIKIRNSLHLTSMEYCDWGLTPTMWQASQLPEAYRPKVSVIHEGVNTDIVKPDPEAIFQVNEQLSLSAKNQVVTFVNRNLEPYRGFHIFMRALPSILKSCPQAHVVLVGGDDVSYGRRPEKAENWRQVMMKEVGSKLDMNRVHFVGKLPYARYLQLLQVSSAHVYLTYPFVLSWSMLESMAAGCAVVASNTKPVTEVIQHGHDGLLVDFFDHKALAKTVAEVVNNGKDYVEMRQRARQTILERYDLMKVCLPQQLDLLNNLPAYVKGADKA